MLTDRAHRPLIIGHKGGVASNHPAATLAGLDILREGGHAADAAVAVSLVLGVVEPQMSGLGGDGFYHHYDAAQCHAKVYNGSGLSPRSSTAESFHTEGMPLAGPRSASVPGALGALFQMHQRHGTLPWSRLCAPAINAAAEGFGVTFTFHRFSKNYQAKLAGHTTTRATFLRHGEPAPIGTFIKQPALRDTLSSLASEGADSFYRGRIASSLLLDFETAGIPITRDDLAKCEPEEQEPLLIRYRGFDVLQTPPNSMGFTLLQELLITQHFDLTRMGHLSPEAIHVLVEAKKLAFQDRERHASDPRHREVPLKELLSAGYAESLAAKINMRKAANLPVGGTLQTAGTDTTYFCVTDAQGNAVSAIQSLNNAFGSGITLQRTGVVMNNRMTCWHLQEGHPNELRPGKRVRHTMNAPLLLKDGKAWALFGTPGADDQVQVNLQMATGLIDFSKDPQSLAESPRWSSDQPGQEANWPHGGSHMLTLESSMPQATIEELRRLGHQVKEVAALEGPCSVALARALDEGGWAFGSDPRRDGWAAAY